MANFIKAILVAILTLNQVSVTRGDFVLCAGVSFVLTGGQIVHLLGENGLGKTTLLYQITGLLPTLVGQIKQDGNLLFVSHDLALHEQLTVAQNLRFLLSLYHLTPTDDQLANALKMVGLTGFESVPVAQLSAGQGRRVGLARLWLTDPTVTPLWVLDEPLTALDVAMVDRLCQRFLAFCADGGAILLTSHQALPIKTDFVNLADFLTPMPVANLDTIADI